MKTTTILIISAMVLSTNVYASDIFIGHAYYFKCPYYKCDAEAIYARPLFKKMLDGWQVFPNSKDIDYTPENFKQSYTLFPNEIEWFIFNNDHSLIGKEIVKNNKPIEWLINTGAAQMQLNPEVIRKNIDKEVDVDLTVDLILSTNANAIFSKFKTRETTDVEIYESAIKNVKDIGNSLDPTGTIEKRAIVYSIENIDIIAILEFEPTGKCEICEINSMVLTKVENKWEFAFDGKSINYDRDSVSFWLKTISDFDNDGQNEYIFNLSSGINRYGYVLWKTGMAKPLVYKYSSH